MPDALDLRLRTRREEKMAIEEFLDALFDYDDPLRILVRCEEEDERTGCSTGYHLELYYQRLKERSK